MIKKEKIKSEEIKNKQNSLELNTPGKIFNFNEQAPGYPLRQNYINN